MRFGKRDRQRIIDGYLSASGRNHFHPAEFIDWLADQPEHEAYSWFFGRDDAEMAREHRIGMARQMASGLRLVVGAAEAQESRVVSVSERRYPALVSPVAGRRSGGGYVRVDPSDERVMEELREQGRQALRSWLERYGSAFEDAGTDLSALEEIAASGGDAVSPVTGVSVVSA